MSNTVFIVDDEKMIREGLIDEIPWKDLNLELQGSAEDGEMALEAMNGNFPDIIISDIRMPFMDGLELMQKVRELSPDTKFVFISGHDEFTYAQQAIKLGAYDYILKPLEVSYLIDILIKLTDEINEKETTTLQARKGLAALKRDIVRNIIFRNEKTATALEELNKLSIKPFENLCVLIAQIDDFYLHTYEQEPEEMKELLHSFYDFINQKVMEWNGIEIAGSHQEAILVLEGKDKEVLKGIARVIYQAGKEWKSNTAGPTISIGVGKIKRKMDQLSLSYKEARTALDHKFILGSEQIIFYEEIDKTEPVRNSYAEELKSLYKSLELGKKNEILKEFDLLKKKMMKSGFSKPSFQIIVSDLFLKIVSEINDAGGSMDQLFINTENIYKEILSNETAEGGFQSLNEVLQRAMNFLSMKKDGRYDAIIQRALYYIKENFSRSSLSLDEVAREANMSSCYFSVIFKRETGKTPIEYITEARMVEAGKLLMGNALKTYEISYAVGYENPTYFSNVFKKYYHITPSDYRNSNKI